MLTQTQKNTGLEPYASDCLRLVSAAAHVNSRRYTRPAEALGDVVSLLGFRVASGRIPGYACLEPDTRTIWISDRLSRLLDNPASLESVARFSVAHELGHIRLHSRSLSRLTIQDERQADQYAAEFLMPAPIMAQKINGVIDQDLLRYLASWFMVSVTAVRVRLLRLGYQIGKAAFVSGDTPARRDSGNS